MAAVPSTSCIVEAVEAHRFMPAKRLRWRNGELEFASLVTWPRASTPTRRPLASYKVRDALDDRSLAILARREDIRERRGRRRPCAFSGRSARSRTSGRR
jgi:hypothetical protein